LVNVLDRGISTAGRLLDKNVLVITRHSGIIRITPLPDGKGQNDRRGAATTSPGVKL
jgi:hypothetical protein